MKECDQEDETEEKERRNQREKKAREEASLREREKEVQRALAPHLRDRDKERLAHQHGEAMQHFTALLTDLVIWLIFFFQVSVYLLGWLLSPDVFRSYLASNLPQ